MTTNGNAEIDARAAPSRVGPAAAYSGTEWLLAGLEIAFHFGLKVLPTSQASEWGGRFVAKVIRATRPHLRDDAAKTLRLIEPTWPEDRILETAERHIDNLGRAIAEYSVMDRLWGEGRVAVVGAETMLKAAANEPLLIVCVHTGHWDVVGAALSGLGLRWSSFYAPRTKLSERWISSRTRERFKIPLLPPNAAGARTALNLLRAGGHVSIFCDEAREGSIRGPLFGRPPHLKGNLAIAVRIARIVGCRIAFCGIQRLPDCRFLVTIEGPVALASGPVSDTSLLGDVAYLNGFIEPQIRRNLDQWFFLDNSLQHSL